ncbi:hypothetical protein, partial [Shimia sp.]|uniref:hypothetical protein n=1 Tax=Shimia sp. TaxID=1954381 RepID=UPI003299670C
CKFSETRTLFFAHLNMPQNVKEKPAIRNIILPDLLKMLDIGVFQQNKPLLPNAAESTEVFFSILWWLIELGFQLCDALAL